MQTLKSKRNIFKSLAALSLATLLLSFSMKRGGEGFEILLNNKVVLQQFGNNMNEVKTLKLDQASGNDELSVRYYHCGRSGKNRSIIIKDQANKVLKEWKFSDASDAADRMTCKVKEVVKLTGTKGATLKLYYSSNELSKEKQLVSLNVLGKSIAKL